MLQHLRLVSMKFHLTVGIGRPFLYAFSSYGQDGVEKALKILRVCHVILVYVDNVITLSQDEFEMNMRLLGAQTIKDVTPDMIDASAISVHIAATPVDRLYDNNCKIITSWAYWWGN